MIKRLALNTASNMGTLVIKLAITFVMTPILIKNLGHYDYGVWEMIGGIIGYMGMLDLGIRPAVSRFAARYIALKDEAALRILYSTAWFFLLVVGFLIAIILTCWGIFFPELIAEHSTDTQRYTLLLLILAAQLLITFPSYTTESFMESYQEYYLKNNITIINSFIGFAAIYYYMTPSNALVLLAGVNALGVCTKYVFLVWYMQYRRPFLRIKAAYLSFVQLKELLRFSIKTVIQGISTRMENSTDAIVIGTILGPALVPLYSVPANLLNHIRGICVTLTHVFMPYLSGLSATNDHEKIKGVYLSGSKLVVSLTLLLTVGAVTLGEDFLRLWVGSEIASSASGFLLIIAAFTVLPLLNPLSSRYLTAIDKHGFFAKWQPVVAVSNLVVSVILIYPMGIAGVALGSLIPALVFQPIVLHVCCKELQISMWSYVSHVLLPWVIPCAGMIAAIHFLSKYIVIEGYIPFLEVAIAGSIIFMILSYIFAFNANEKNMLLNLIRRKKIDIGE